MCAHPEFNTENVHYSARLTLTNRIATAGSISGASGMMLILNHHARRQRVLPNRDKTLRTSHAQHRRMWILNPQVANNDQQQRLPHAHYKEELPHETHMCVCACVCDSRLFSASKTADLLSIRDMTDRERFDRYQLAQCA